MARRSRREFLHESLFAAAAAAVAGGIQREAWAWEPKAVGRTVGPNDQIRVAVIGVKSRGRDHVRGYNAFKDVTIAAICDTDLNQIPGAIKIVTDSGKPAPKAVQDLRRIMDDPEIDAVSIATPNHWHSLAAIWAMQSGKDVYVEKPVSHNVHEGRVMVETARKYGRICQAGTQIRSQPGTIQAIEYVRSGKIGKVKVARGLCYKTRNSIGKVPPGEIPAGVDYNLWLGPAEYEPFHQNRFHYNWHWAWNTGNGDLGNQGIHQMDVARWGLGKDELPRSVIGLGGRLGYVDDGETPNTHVSVMDYGDSQLIFEVRGLKTPRYRGAAVGNVFHGTDGYVVLTGYDEGAAFDNDGKVVTTFKGGGDHFRNFIDCMRSRKVQELNGDILQGHLSSALCHLGNISYKLGDQASFTTQPEPLRGNDEALETWERTRQHLVENGVDLNESTYRLGRKLSIDPGRERFDDSREANGYLFDDYRPGFAVPRRA
jgi:predicted dehydrogenase